MADRTFKVEKNVQDAIMVLEIVIKTLERHNIRYYLDFGTLIGAVRDKALIPWDDDIDISLVDKDDYSKIPSVLKDIRRKHGLRTYLFTFEEGKAKRVKQRKQIYTEEVSFASSSDFQIAKVRTNKFLSFGRGNTCVDIFFKYHHKDSVYWMAYGRENSVPNQYELDRLVRVDFYGLSCTIPQEYDRYLSYKYGDWKTPKEDWSHDGDDLTVSALEKR